MVMDRAMVRSVSSFRVPFRSQVWETFFICFERDRRTEIFRDMNKPPHVFFCLVFISVEDLKLKKLHFATGGLPWRGKASGVSQSKMVDLVASR